MADFYVLFHDNPSDSLREGRCGQRAVVRPVIVSVGGKQTSWVELVKLHHTALKLYIGTNNKRVGQNVKQQYA